MLLQLFSNDVHTFAWTCRCIPDVQHTFLALPINIMVAFIQENHVQNLEFYSRSPYDTTVKIPVICKLHRKTVKSNV